MNNSNLIPTYARQSVEFVSGDGICLTDTNGKIYLDFLSGIAVTGFGHSHPDILSAVQNQVQNLWHVSNLFTSSLQEKVAEQLVDAYGDGSVFFCNSGTEANEAAIKFARKYGNGKYHIITALGGFHGRTYGSLSASGQPKLWNGFFPINQGFTSVEYGNISAIISAITPETIAIMLEPIQGENGIIIPDELYLQQVREVCDQRGLILILDEIQTGIGRTGKLFNYQWTTIQPDIITLAKGIANGLPLGAVICSPKISHSIQPGDHGSTFGGNPVSLSAAQTVLQLLTPDILNYNDSIGNYFIQQLQQLEHPLIQSIRGKGLMIGVELSDGVSSKIIAKELLLDGIVVGTSKDSVLRILPPFVIQKEHIHIFCEKLSAVLYQHHHEAQAV